MLPFFPTPYPDELLYSVLARYHIWSRNFSLKDTIDDLFGRKTASAVIDLPNNLKAVSDQLPEGSINTPDRFIQKHTLFPLFKPFLPKERVDKLIHSMINGGDIHARIGVMASSISSPKFLRYCPECVNEDERKYGEPYWHRTHQVPGVEICPIHQTFLVESNIATTARQNKHEFIALDCKLTKQSVSKKANKKEFEHEMAIAEAVYWLLNNDVPVLGTEKIHNRYINYLKKMNLTAAASRRVRQKELMETFRHFYGHDLLEKLNCAINYGQDNWLSKLVRKPRTTAHPIKHILLIRFIGLTPEQFFEEDMVYHPFGKGPWLCLNAAADHYKQPVIDDCKVTRDYKTGVPVGTFTCSCGFVYSRRGPDKEESDQFKIGRIKEFGPVWREKLIQLKIKEERGLRETARILNVDPGTVKNQLEKLKQEEMDTPSANNFEIERNKYRTNWLKAVESNEGKSKTEIRKIAQAEYAWLYRHDREWLDTNSPKPLKRRKYSDNRVDWAKRDNEIAEKVKEVANEELNNPLKKPERLTISSIGKKIGELSLLQKHLNKLPKTKKLLGDVIESIEEFQIRRVKYVAQQIREREELVREWMIVREAGLRPGYSEKVKQAIEAEMEKEMKIII